MSRSKTGAPKLKTVELVRTSYQPTKAEKQERFRTAASFEEAVDALLGPVNARWIDRPGIGERSADRRISGVLYIIPFRFD